MDKLSLTSRQSQQANGAGILSEPRQFQVSSDPTTKEVESTNVTISSAALALFMDSQKMDSEVNTPNLNDSASIPASTEAGPPETPLTPLGNGSGTLPPDPPAKEAPPPSTLGNGSGTLPPDPPTAGNAPSPEDPPVSTQGNGSGTLPPDPPKKQQFSVVV